MNPLAILLVGVGVVVFSHSVFAAHYIVGIVNDAADATTANGKTVIIWNPLVGISDNVTGVVGPSGNSLVSRMYLVDCEMLQTPCQVGDALNITLVDDGSGYVATHPVNVTISGFGFDIAPNLSLNTPPLVTNWTVEDYFTNPLDEIDLTAAGNTSIYCSGIVTEYDGIETLTNASIEFFSSGNSFFGDVDDLNYHYSNNSCPIDTSYGGANEAFINCSLTLAYFAVAGPWQCVLNISDSTPASVNYSDTTTVNELLAIGTNSTVDFGTVDALAMSNETLIEVINYGNIMINLSLSGYGKTPGDGNAMQCLEGNISVEDLKYNLTTSNPGAMSFSIADSLYLNLSSNPVVNEFNLAFRTNDTHNFARNNTFWRIRVPMGVTGDCNGSIIFGATKG